MKLLEAAHSAKGEISLLTKVVIEFDYANDQICFSLPEYGFPKKKGEGQVDWSVISRSKQLLNPDGCWGEAQLVYECGVVRLDILKDLIERLSLLFSSVFFHSWKRDLIR